MSLNFTANIFCVITGASRGIGRQIAEEFARKSPKITFVLIARSEPDLGATKAAISRINSAAVVHCFSLDLTATDGDTFRRVLSKFDADSHETAVVFHNAGQIGRVERVSKMDDCETWRSYYNLNVVSVAALNSVFLQTVRGLKGVFVVNVTSLVGRKPFKYLAMYGSGKAARDLYFQVLALEEPQVKVLNYSPGMVETSMAQELVRKIETYGDSEISSSAQKLTAEQTVLKLVAILEKGGFDSGKIIDYYD